MHVVLAAITNPQNRVIAMTLYAAGLRVSEAVSLRITDIDSKRMLLHVVQGKGRKDRLVTLSPVLLMAPGIVHITGDDSNGDVRAGTGLVLDKHHILTCRHVVQDMKLHPEQSFQGMKCKISRNEIKSHQKHDVAVIRVYDELRPISGLVFQSPVIAQTVFALGYPRVPMAKQHVLTIHHGAVTYESVEMFAGNNLFLYSSISRPGNSGGPIVSDEGYVVGMSAQLNNTNRLGDCVSLPHNAGIDSKTIIDSIVDIGLDLNMDFEEYE